MKTDLISCGALLENYGLKNAVKYGNETAEQQRNSYSTLMLYEIADMIEEAPAVDAEPVRHGRYEFVGMDMMAGTRAFYFGTCSECHERINFEDKHKNYCPNCGAKMRGDDSATD